MLSARWQGRRERSRAGRPSRAEIDPAALDLIARHGPQILRTARRYSACPDDAEDAYQRGLEILLTKAPSTREEELVPWLKTVVKHEAFAIRRQRERAAPVACDEEALDRAGGIDEPGEHAERYERLRLGAEALRRLKPQEVRCLLLLAEGYSYKQICELTGFSYTKVNRCLTEGRAAFLARLDGIQSGAECERLAPLLSALADGEASAEDMAALRPHLRGCLACRATLREQRAVPREVAALLPAPALLAGGGGLLRWLESLAGSVTDRAGSLGGAASDRAASLAVKAHGAAEIVSAQKVAAVAASTAVLAGGGVATVRSLEGAEPRGTARAAAAPTRPASAPTRQVAAPGAAGARRAEPGPGRHAPAEPRRRRRRPRERAAAPTREFDPTGARAGAAAPAPTFDGRGEPAAGRSPRNDPAGAEFGP